MLNVPDFYSMYTVLTKKYKSKVPSQINHKHAPFQSLCSLQLYYISLPTGPDTPTARPKPDNSHQVTFLGEPQMAQLKQDNFCYLKKTKRFTNK